MKTYAALVAAAVVAFATPASASIPDPGTWGLLLLGFGTLGAALRRRSPLARTSFS
jgi:hypothetical protein